MSRKVVYCSEFASDYSPCRSNPVCPYYYLCVNTMNIFISIPMQTVPNLCSIRFGWRSTSLVNAKRSCMRSKSTFLNW
ncbi:hypothetical protein C8Q74DRAFT_1293470 [Fomes fomentarius]|nr:hypothetical protein C8Q74DRAFT_1293470 [Fomes fomentarius]